MKIRVTTKLLNIAGIKPVKDVSDPLEELPGEWYAASVSLLRQGKLAIHFLHYPTYISILIPGKSLNKIIPLLPAKVSAFLKRHGYEILEPEFKLNTEPEIYTTNSRSMLGHMNQIKYNLEYHFARAYTVNDIDYDRLEDIHFDYLFGGKNLGSRYIKPMEILDKLVKNRISNI